ncbi:anaerobic sulfatase maturase [Vibrio rumoiensis]|uniref:Anaerobic sulfatase maturase n=1 Tax=Vibrio rumoiensis 1S-45 TaxID=1188252 RepID=A0A1E5E3E5_9VIBR|nr:anaerobic sulfatase maturase [Vibrio rumoiensis]OEF25896.1 anaerobic sulfatase maturase [Vibrio rumoiensis 1S-45]
MTTAQSTPTIPYSIFIKAESAKCNLDCHYCYYLRNEEKNLPGMDVELAEKVVKDHILSQPEKSPQVDFIWHGGEPMMRGLEFYEQVVTAQKATQTKKQIVNTIQTNGTLINDRWAQFFKDENFMVGISIDGPNLINDIARIDKKGHSSFERTMRGLEHLKKFDVEFNTLTVINNKSYKMGKEIYSFLKDNGSGYMQFQPCIDHEMDRRFDYDWTLTGGQWGVFLCDVFDAWCEDIGKTYVQFFENCLMILMDYPSQMCHHAPTCGQQLMMESDGRVFSCDHFGYDEFKIGQVKTDEGTQTATELAQMVSSQEQRKFGQDKFDTLSDKCKTCDFLALCNGGCPKNRVGKFVNANKVEQDHNVLCEGYEMFFKYALPRLLKMTDAMKQGYSPAFYKLV